MLPEGVIERWFATDGEAVAVGQKLARQISWTFTLIRLNDKQRSS